MYETTVTLVGTIIGDLSRRRTADGAELVSFRMAANERRRDRESGEWHNGETTYARVTCWRKLVAGVGASLGKGDPVMVTGRMYTREYQVEGSPRMSLEIDASAVGPDLARCQVKLVKTPAIANPAAGQDATGDRAAPSGTTGAG